MLKDSIYIAPISTDHTEELSDLFRTIVEDATAASFHPHPFTTDDARRIANYVGRDLYVGLFLDSKLVGYGLLRGWDEGFSVPSLGIYLAPEARGRGLSPIFMQELHRLAAQRGAEQVRLKVYPSNTVAIRLYERLGYEFGPVESGQLVGFADIGLDYGV